MYRHIMIALDGSHNAALALQQAIGLAAHCGARLTLAHVASLQDFNFDELGVKDKHALYLRAQQRAGAILDEAESEARKGGVREVVRFTVESWDGVREMVGRLLDEAGRSGVDLLVLGTHGRRGWRHLLLGSFAETTLRATRLPLLVVRNPGNDEDEPGFSRPQAS